MDSNKRDLKAQIPIFDSDFQPSDLLNKANYLALMLPNDKATIP